ncbi:hypothetical protein PIB30_082975, partial [Stylosanthes scabra]|nr:hypothetical protein [Stylosanthes scabra]
PRICVGSQQAHIPSHVYITSNVTFTSPSLTHPRIGVEDPHICVEGTLAASNHTRPTPKSFMRGSKLHKTHAYAWKSTHMRSIASICVEGKLNFQVHQAHVYALKQAYAWRPSKLKAKL